MSVEKFTEALKVARFHNSRRHIGQIFGVSASQVGRWENGRSLPTHGALIAATTVLRNLVTMGCKKCGANTLAVALGSDTCIACAETPPVANHLQWNGTEWVDDRCGCRYHPDDNNHTHGGAPHVHLCDKHIAARGAEVIKEKRAIAARALKDASMRWGREHLYISPDGLDGDGVRLRADKWLLREAERLESGVT